MRIVFIVNNKNNRLKKKLPALHSFFEVRFPGQVEIQCTLRHWHAAELAKITSEEGCDYLISAGGDGTLHEVINGLLLSEVPPDRRPAVGLLPLGSANDFARTAGISSSSEDLAKWISNRTIQKIDAGMIRLDATGEMRYFINVAGLGLGAEVVQLMNRKEPFLGAALHYYYGIFRGFLQYRKKEVVCRGNAWEWKGRMLQMAVGNGRYFGNGICIVPQAALADGTLGVSIFGDLSLWDYMKNIQNLKKGNFIEHPGVIYRNSNELFLKGDGCGIEADGEFLGSLPATVSVIPSALSFLMPPAQQESHFVKRDL